MKLTADTWAVPLEIKKDRQAEVEPRFQPIYILEFGFDFSNILEIWSFNFQVLDLRFFVVRVPCGHDGQSLPIVTAPPPARTNLIVVGKYMFVADFIQAMCDLNHYTC